MTDEELNKIGQLMDQKLTASEQRVIKLVDQKVVASEQRVIKLVDQKLVASEQRVITEVGKFMEDHLFPMLDDKADKSDIARLGDDIERLERKLDNFSGQVIDHGHDLQKIKTIPAIAHQLRSK